MRGYLLGRIGARQETSTEERKAHIQEVGATALEERFTSASEMERRVPVQSGRAAL